MGGSFCYYEQMVLPDPSQSFSRDSLLKGRGLSSFILLDSIQVTDMGPHILWSAPVISTQDPSKSFETHLRFSRMDRQYASSCNCSKGRDCIHGAALAIRLWDSGRLVEPKASGDGELSLEPALLISPDYHEMGKVGIVAQLWWYSTGSDGEVERAWLHSKLPAVYKRAYGQAVARWTQDPEVERLLRDLEASTGAGEQLDLSHYNSPLAKALWPSINHPQRAKPRLSPLLILSEPRFEFEPSILEKDGLSELVYSVALVAQSRGGGQERRWRQELSRLRWTAQEDGVLFYLSGHGSQLPSLVLATWPGFESMAPEPFHYRNLSGQGLDRLIAQLGELFGPQSIVFQPWSLAEQILSPELGFEIHQNGEYCQLVPLFSYGGKSFELGSGQALLEVVKDWDDEQGTGTLTRVLRDEVAEAQGFQDFLATVDQRAQDLGILWRVEDGLFIVEVDRRELSEILVPFLRDQGWIPRLSGGEEGGASVSAVRLSAQEGIGQWLDFALELVVGDELLNLTSLDFALEGRILEYRGGQYYIESDQDLQLLELLHQRGKFSTALRVSDKDLDFAARLAQLSSQNEAQEAEVLTRRKNLLESLERIAGSGETTVAVGDLERDLEASDFAGTLRPYQLRGLSWLMILHKAGFGGLLADDMGLGKTVQLLAYAALIREQQPFARILVVAPVSTLWNWEAEAKRFLPHLSCHRYHGTARKPDQLVDHPFVITSYATLRQDLKHFSQLSVHTLVLDEAQTVKNRLTDSFRAVETMSQLANQVFNLTGTPVENRSSELWAHFHLLNRGLLGSWREFNKRFAKPIEKGEDSARTALAQMVKPFLLRRKKEQVLDDLPPRIETEVFIDLAEEQMRFYDALRIRLRKDVLDMIQEKGMGRAGFMVLSSITRLRQAALCPEIIDPEYATVPSTKLDVLSEKLEEVVEEGHKVLVFSQFTSLLDRIRTRVEAHGFDYAYLDGSTTNRQELIDRFNTDPDQRIFLLSLKAGGLGINLTSADYVFIVDPWWNPALESQAVDRAHRIGQKQTVFVERLIARGTIEERILGLQRAKKQLAEQLVGQNQNILDPKDVEAVLGLFD